LIEEQAIVISCDGEIAQIEALRRSACGSCSAKSGCGTSILDRVLGRRPMRLSVANRIGARVGERVIIGVPESGLLRAAVSAYLLPLLALIAGAIGGKQLGYATGFIGAESASLVGAVLGFALALRWLKGYSGRLAEDPRYRPVILRRETGTSAFVGLT